MNNYKLDANTIREQKLEDYPYYTEILLYPCQHEIVNSAINCAMYLDGHDSKGCALETICQFYLAFNRVTEERDQPKLELKLLSLNQYIKLLLQTTTGDSYDYTNK